MKMIQNQELLLQVLNALNIQLSDEELRFLTTTPVNQNLVSGLIKNNFLITNSLSNNNIVFNIQSLDVIYSEKYISPDELKKISYFYQIDNTNIFFHHIDISTNDLNSFITTMKNIYFLYNPKHINIFTNISDLCDKLLQLNWQIKYQNYNDLKLINEFFHKYLNINFLSFIHHYDQYYNIDLHKIIFVKENNNNRFAIAQSANIIYNIYCDYTDPVYNYIDINRYYIKIKFFAPDLYNSYIFDELSYYAEHIDSETLSNILQYINLDTIKLPNTNKPVFILNNDIIEQALQQLHIVQTQIQKEEELRKFFKMKLHNFLNSTNIDFKINEIHFTNNKAVYQDHILYRDDNWVYSLFKDILDYSNLIFANPEKLLWDELLLYFCERVPLNKEVIIGNIPIKITTNKNYYINNIKINSDEILTCLVHAINFKTLDEYNTYLTNVSKCSLKHQFYIKNGLNVNIIDTNIGLNAILHFPIIEKDNTLYLEINNKLVKIKNLSKLITLVENKQNYVNILTFIEKLSNTTEVKPEDLSNIIKNAQELYFKTKKQQEDLFNKLCNNINAIKLSEYRFGHIYLINPIKIQGKLNTYIVDTATARVFNFYTGKYICMIDKFITSSVQEKLINRLLALKNDNIVVNSIYTLKEV